MDFRVLGVLGVGVGGRAVVLGGPRQRALLAALVSRAGETVRISLLCNDIWDVPPAAAESNVRTYVARLRPLLHDPDWQVMP
jgi:DNA-binding SARP family transcriptional activator